MQPAGAAHARAAGSLGLGSWRSVLSELRVAGRLSHKGVSRYGAITLTLLFFSHLVKAELIWLLWVYEI